MKNQLPVLAVLALLLSIGSAAGAGAAESKPAASAPSTAELLEKAIFTEETVGDLNAAIEIYRQIVNEAEANRSHVAQARYRLGVCHLKMGEKQMAIVAFRKLVELFPEQKELVAQAQVQLTDLGHAPTLVTRQAWAPALDNMGAPSPDGRYISYVNWWTGNLAVHDLKTGENRDVTEEGTWDQHPQWAENSIWSPDGRRLAYLWYGEDWSGRGIDLRIIDLDGPPNGSGPRVLYRNEEVNHPRPSAWSRDGKRILGIFHKQDGSHELVLMSVADGSKRVLKTAPRDWYHASVDLSPDGRYVVHDLQPKAGSEDSYDIFLLAADGSKETKLIEHPAYDHAPHWTPDGERVVFISDRAGSNGLWMVDVDGGKAHGPPRLVKPDIGDAVPMGFSRDGTFYYRVETPSSDVYVATLDFETGNVLTPPAKAVKRFEGYNGKPAWSPDGKLLAYVSRRSSPAGGMRSMVLVIRSVESGEEREFSPDISRLLLGSRTAIRWSPNGRSILAQDAGVDGISGLLYVIDARTGAISRTVEDEHGISWIPPAWSPDGRVIFYQRPDPKGFVRPIVSQDLETGRKTELYRGQVLSLTLSPDGKSLAFAERVGASSEQSSRLMIMPATGGEPRELLRLKNMRGDLAWMPDGGHVIYSTSKGDGEPAELWRIALKGGEPQEMGLKVKGLRILSVHPDGRRIAFSSEEGGSEIWMMENLLPELKASR